MTKLIRYLLSAALVFGVYTETGFWTALSIALIFWGIERICVVVARLI